MGLSKEDIKEYTTDELVEKIRDEKVSYKKMKFNHAVSTLDNPMELRSKRRDIARLHTEHRRRELQEDSNN